MTLGWPWPILRQGKFWKHRLHWKISNIFFSETAWPMKAKFYMEHPWVGGTKVCSWDLGHMTKMAATPIFGKKTLKNLLLQNLWANFHLTWYVASGTPAHCSLRKWWPWGDLDLFYGKVNFGNIGFYTGKSENHGFFDNYCSLRPEKW